MSDDLVERLQPRWATDEELTRAAAKRDLAMRAIVSDFLVANNALKAEAASRITTLEAELAKRDEALPDAFITEQTGGAFNNYSVIVKVQSLADLHKWADAIYALAKLPAPKP